MRTYYLLFTILCRGYPQCRIVEGFLDSGDKKMYKEKFSKEVTERVVNPSCLKTMARNLNSEVRPMLGQNLSAPVPKFSLR